MQDAELRELTASEPLTLEEECDMQSESGPLGSQPIGIHETL